MSRLNLRRVRISWFLIGMLAAATIAAEESKSPATRSGEDRAAAPDSATEWTFELTVVGPDKKPIPEANVEFRLRPTPTPDEIRRGTFVREESYSTTVTADAQGRAAIARPEPPKSLNVKIITPGFGPYWAAWSSSNHPEPIPRQFRAKLESGWSIGGIVVDDQGTPLADATIHPSIEYKKRPGKEERQLGIGTKIRTDEAGKWRFDSIPVSMSEVHLAISHPAFKSERRAFARGEFGIKPGEEPSRKIPLDRGLTVTGRVTDDAGKPIAGALIRTKHVNEEHSAQSGADGRFRLSGCEPGMGKIVVSAQGRAIDMKELPIEPQMGPVDFSLAPGGKVRVRVLDRDGKPVPKARIFFQNWRGPRYAYFEFEHVNEYADENGVWEWDEAPLDEFQADICPPDGMQLHRQTLRARDEEYVFHTFPALVISGKVIDAESKKPVEKFAVIPGTRWPGGGPQPVRESWSRSERFETTDGTYRHRETYGRPNHLLRIEADGYLPAVSRDIADDEGNVTIDFALVRGQNVAGRVVLPNLKPAADARIALGIAGSQIHIRNGEFLDGSTNATRTTTDEAGLFHFPPQEKAFQLVIIHPAGFAHVKSPAEWTETKIIRLKAWARVEGTLWIGSAAVAGEPIVLHSSFNEPRRFDPAEPRIWTQYEATSGKEGQFVFERVIPGETQIGREIRLWLGAGMRSIAMTGPMIRDLPAGETTRIELGGAGRPVIGTLQPPEGLSGKVPWNLAMIHVQRIDLGPRDLAPLPFPDDVRGDAAKRAAWLEEWYKTDEGQAYKTARDEHQRRVEESRFAALVDSEGKFRLDDLPAGDYQLSVYLEQQQPRQQQQPRLTWNQKFTIPPMEGGRSDEPLDVGKLPLGK